MATWEWFMVLECCDEDGYGGYSGWVEVLMELLNFCCNIFLVFSISLSKNYNFLKLTRYIIGLYSSIIPLSKSGDPEPIKVAAPPILDE